MTGPYSVRPWRSRREFLKSSVAVAAGAYGLSPSFAMAAPVPEKFDGSAFKLKAPEPNAKSGGVLRHGMPLRAPHFDIHQAGTIFILGAAACMFDNLIRHDPNDGAKTIIPDLAHSWEIAPDGQTYTFHLRQGVQFHDVAELTSEDVKATYDRIVKPPTGISIPRLMRKLLKKQGFAPKLLVTDKLGSYGSAFRQLRLTCPHDRGRTA
jgi:ABC-type transport system substrate-binding protein